MDKLKGAYKTIGEVSKELDIPSHILRFWESKFDRLRLIKRKNNHRYYNAKDISFLIHIRQLINEEGYTIKGVQIYLKKDNTLTKTLSKTKTLSNKEKEYFQIIKEIKKDIQNIINNK